MRRVGIVVFVFVATACTHPAPVARPTPSALPSPTPVPVRTRLVRPSPSIPTVSYAATAKVRSVAVYDARAGRVVRRLADPQPSGAPLTFLVKGTVRTDWLEVYLPVRPNGSTGWIRAGDVTVATVTYRVDVLRAEHRLRVYDKGRLVRELPVAIGTRSTPTPGGTFYLKELLIPSNPGGFYGPYAYGLSGFSNVLTSFGGGEGVIGIHGTNEPGVIGTDVSHGCIRLRNADITWLARRLPLGTPVRILA
jgi:lipoprotein-anchoring transpeptidase ErfK/SrfK